jgi:hypothetical protein
MPQVQPGQRSREDRILSEIRPTGIVEDIPAAEVPPTQWTQMQNFYMRLSYAQRIGGLSQFFADWTDEALNIANVFSATINFWTVMGKTTIQVIDQGGNVDDITPALYASPVLPAEATTSIINGFPVFNFRQSPPAFWDLNTGNIAQPLPGWPAATSCRSIRTFQNFLFALNMTEGGNEFPTKLRWSNAAEPGTVPTEWVATATNNSGDASLADTAGGIVDAGALRGQFVIYKQHATYLANFVGGSFVFTFRKFLTTSGIMAANCATEALGQHVVMTDGDVIIHDGQNIKSLVDEKLRRFIFLQIDPVNFLNSFVFNYRAAKEVWICFPTQGFTEPNVAVIWDYAHDELSIRELPETWSHAQSGLVIATTAVLDWDNQTDTWQESSGSWNRAQFTGAFERVLSSVAVSTPTGLTDPLGDGNSRLLFVDDTSTTRDGSAVVGQISRESLDLGTPESLKYVRRVWPRIQGSSGTVVKVRVGVQDEPSAPISWSVRQDFNVNVDDFLNFDASGRYISVRFEDDDAPGATPNPIWSIHGFDLEYTFQGDFGGG